jgi:hypothetical protein
MSHFVRRLKENYEFNGGLFGPSTLYRMTDLQIHIIFQMHLPRLLKSKFGKLLEHNSIFIFGTSD